MPNEIGRHISLLARLGIGLGLVVLILALPHGGHAQVPGRCISNCNIPSGNSQQQQQPQPLDPRMFWIGVAAHVQGDVTFIYPNGQRVTGDAAARAPIPLGTRVVTGPGAKAQFLLIDETGFTVGPNSEMVMDRFVYDPSSTTPSQINLGILKGNFRFTTGKVARGRTQLDLKTPVVAIGIRGTDFEVQADPGGLGHVLVYEGQVEAAEYDTNRIFLLNPGQRLRYDNFQIVGVE